MALINPESDLSVSENFNIHKIGVTDGSLLQSYEVAYRPISDFRDSNRNPLEYVIAPSGTSFIDLQEHYFYVKLEVKRKDGAKLEYANATPWTSADDNDIVAIASNALHSLWSYVEVYVGDKQINCTNSTSYPYLSFFQSLINNSKTRQDTILKASGLYLDNNEATAENPNYKARRTLTAKGKACDFIGKLNIDLFKSDKFLIHSLPLRIKLVRSDDSFVLHHKKTASTETLYSVHLKEAKLVLTHKTATENVIGAVERALKLKPALYDFERQLLKSFPIPVQSLNYSIENAFTAQIPEKLIIAFVQTSAFNGRQDLNPFNFENCNLKSLQIFIDGRKAGDIRADFDNNLYHEAFYKTMTDLNVFNENYEPSLLTPEIWAKKGFTFFCFDLTNDRQNLNSYELIKRGHVRITFEFAEALTDSYTALLMYTIPGIIQIDKYRNVELGTNFTA